MKLGLCGFLLLAVAGSTVGESPKMSTKMEPFRGVNIGGWLVLEAWIAPTLFASNGLPTNGSLGEWGFCEKLGKEKALSVLKSHWETWVDRKDLETLRASGINWLRVPVGYWIVDIRAGEPFVAGGIEYLKRLLRWSEEVGLKVLVDLHGAPGSQNGHDNSGRVGPIEWNQPKNIKRTIDDLGRLAAELEEFPALYV
jgi:glucan 1,3-beta-glucosidase